MPDTPKPDAPVVLYFVRGRGRGHANAALEVARALAANGFDSPLQFVSYASGAAALCEAGEQVIDLGLPESSSFVETVVPAGELLRRCRPRLAVAHEEFAVPAAAGILGIRSVFLTDWFSDPSHSNMRALNPAGEILFLDEPGVFEEPPYLAGKVRYLGPILRQRQYSADDRARARMELGLEHGQLAVGVFVHPGRRDETVAPVCDPLLGALERVGFPRKIFWLSDPDDVLAVRLRARPDATILDSSAPFDRLMAACDLAITKGNRDIVLELASFGVPTISVSHGLNRIDDIRTARVSGNVTLAASRLTPDTLAGVIREKMRSDPSRSREPAIFRDGAQGVAQRLIKLAAAG